MNIIVDKERQNSLHRACTDGNLENVIAMINNDNINSVDSNGELPLEVCINQFLNNISGLEGNKTPKYWDNPFVQIILYLTREGASYNQELLHLCLFNDKPIFTLNDFFEFTTNSDNKYPIHNSIELIQLCHLNSTKYDAYKKEYVTLLTMYQQYGVDILDKCRNIDQAKDILIYPKYNNKTCIDLAMEIEYKEFIAHKYVQTEFEHKWLGTASDYSFVERLVCTLCPIFVLDKCWYSNPCIKYYLHTFFSFIFLFLLYVQTYTLTSIIPSQIELLIVIWIVGFITAEIHQINTMSLINYFTDIWNYCDIFITLNFIIIIIMRIGLYMIYKPNDIPYTLILTEHMLVVNIILSFIRTLNICQIHSVLGPILLMIGKMIKDMLLFLSILMVFFFGFSLGLTKIYNRVDNQGLSTISQTSFTLFLALFGEFDIDTFRVGNYTEIENFGIFIFGLYLIIAVIILMNLFIAILSNTYAIIQEDSDIEWKYSRARLIDTYSLYTIMPPPLNFIECIILLIFHKPSSIITPYFIDEPDTIDVYQKNTQNIVKIYKDEPLEILTSTNISDLQYQINKLSKDIQNLTQIISISPVQSPCRNISSTHYDNIPSINYQSSAMND